MYYFVLLKSGLLRKFNETLMNITFKMNVLDDFPSGFKKGICHQLCKLHSLIDKLKSICSSEIYHRSGNLWFTKRGFLHENLRQSYVYVSICYS